MELMMIFEILERGGRGIRFVKIAEWYVGFGFFVIVKCRFVDHQITKQRCLLVSHVLMRNRKTMVQGRVVKLLRYFFANVLMRLCGFIRGLLCFLQFIVCGSWCLYAFVELRISSAFSLQVLSFCDMFYDTFCSFHLCFWVRFM